jgi:hypothetical protein
VRIDSLTDIRQIPDRHRLYFPLRRKAPLLAMTVGREGGLPNQVRADMVSVLDTEFACLVRKTRRLPLAQFRDNWRSAEMPVGYHRDVSAALLAHGPLG